MKKLMLVAVLVALGALVYSVLKSNGYFSQIANPLPTAGEQIIIATADPYTSDKKNTKEVPYKVEPFVGGLKIPWSFVFTSQNRLLVTEREGSIRAIVDGKLLEKPLISFGETIHNGESGLLGIVLDPAYDSNKLLYVVLSYAKKGSIIEKVLRLKDLGESLVQDKIVFDDIPAAQFHDGGAIKFGPDGKLYISTGDAGDKDNAQKMQSLSGKILRINGDGTIPNDNPFPESPVWSLGHRNPQGFDWYPQSLVMIATEHGPSTFDGPPGGDEVNAIEPGKNYGWPKAHHEIHIEGMEDPKIVFTPAFAPASGMFYSGKVFPQFYGNFFFGGLVGEGIMRVVVDQKSPSKVLSYGKLDQIDYGRIRGVVEGPDGYIYFATSNRDGRGTPRKNDDQIFRIVPESKK